MDVHHGRAECMAQLGDISNVNGDELKAEELWETARPLFEQSVQRNQLTNLNAKLASLSHNESQALQQETLDRLSNLHVATEHPESLSVAESSSSIQIEQIEIMGLEDEKAILR
jgi:hypothetical protein